jgi:hypothetical protein
MSENLEENDFVKVSFEGEFGNQSPIKGRVKEVDTAPEIPETATFVFVMNDKKGGRNLIYTEGVEDDGGEDWAVVSVQNRNITLGKNASWELL